MPVQKLIAHFPAASCCPGPDDAPHWKMCDFCTGMGSFYMRVIGGPLIHRYSDGKKNLYEHIHVSISDAIFVPEPCRRLEDTVGNGL